MLTCGRLSVTGEGRQRNTNLSSAGTGHPTFFSRLHRALLQSCRTEVDCKHLATSPFHPLWSGIPLAAAFASASEFAGCDEWHSKGTTLRTTSRNVAFKSFVEGAAPPFYNHLHQIVDAETWHSFRRLPDHSGCIPCRTEFLITLIEQNSFSQIARPSQRKPEDGECLRVFLIAGEPSGDNIGGSLMAALQDQLAGQKVVFSGVGGARMQQAGLQTLFPMDDLAVMGIAEVIPSILRITLGRIPETASALVRFQPHVVVTIDSKGFCFRVLAKAKRKFEEAGKSPPACIQYVAPSFWYKGGGPQQLAAKWGPVIDHMLCIHPFEAPLCRAAGIPATFVGHPVLEDAWECQSASIGHPWEIHGDGAAFREMHGIGKGTRGFPVVCFLPGSRQQETDRLLPIFRKVLTLLRKDWPRLTAVVVTVPGPVGNKVLADVAMWEGAPVTCIPETEQKRYNAFAACDLAIAASGTVIVQLLLARVPTVVAYGAHWITELVARWIAAVHHMALPNILAGHEIVPEAIFSQCTPERLAQHARSLVTNRFERSLQHENAERVLSLLAPPASTQLIVPSSMTGKPRQAAAGDQYSRENLSVEKKASGEIFSSEGGVVKQAYERPSRVAAKAILQCFEIKRRLLLLENL